MTAGATIPAIPTTTAWSACRIRRAARRCGAATACYDIVGVLGWNDAPVARGRGSAIFLHVARADFAPTEGCIALAQADLRAVLAAGLTGVNVVAVKLGARG